MMDPRASPGARLARPSPWVLAVAVVALVYAWFLAGTTPFTTSADILTALPIVVVAVAAVVLARRRSLAGATLASEHRPAETTRGWWVWALLLGLVVAWELVMLFGMPRSSHPTLSSVEVSITRWQSTKALVAAAWLALGAFLVTR
jgi:NADH:ubiquinone oxidoreductase subunit 6 (subunit J)